MLKDDVLERQRDWEQVLGNIARQLKKMDTPLYVLMGSMAWGRYPFENGGSPRTKDNALMAVGFLIGLRDTCMKAGQMHEWEGTELFERAYEDLRLLQLARRRMNDSGE